MFNKILNSLSTTLYVQIWKNRLRVTDLKSGKFFDDIPLISITNEKINAIGKTASTYPMSINPFSHPRVVVDDFHITEIILRHWVEIVTERKAIFSPIGIIHVMDIPDNGLTKLEKRVLCEISENAGCREVFIYEGNNLAHGEINYNEIKNMANPCKTI